METTVLTRLLEITVYSAAVFLAVGLFRLAFGAKLAPNLKYALWLLVLLRLTVPVTFESAFHLITLPAQATASPVPVYTGGVLLPTPVPAVPPIGALAQERPEPAPSTAAAIVPKQQRSVWRPSLPQALLILWAAGAAAVLLYEIRMAMRLARRIRARGVLPDRGTRALFDEAKEEMHLRRGPDVLLIDDIRSPALTVRLRPKLLLPDGLVDNRSREEQAFSIRHELMHYKRCDHLVLLWLSVLRAIHWFNPVVWLLPRLLRTDMESACDAQVVRSMGCAEKLKYVHLLLEFGQEETEQ